MKINADLRTPSGAIISRCKKYRYALWRTWDSELPRVLFLCLNPSTADAHVDDPTLIRCMNFARLWGYGGMQTGNLFAYRSTDPKMLLQEKDPVGRYNDRWLEYLAKHADLIVAAWGNDGALMGRSERVKRNFPELHCLKLNQSGEPAHPLYLPKTLQPYHMKPPSDPSIPPIAGNVAERFVLYPAEIKRKAEAVRSLIYEVAMADPEVGPLEETLKWGQPSYLTTDSGSGSTIRVDWREKYPNELVIFLNCRTTLVDRYRQQFPDMFHYEGTRALVIRQNHDVSKGEVRDALGMCMSMALRYHLDKK